MDDPSKWDDQVVHMAGALIATCFAAFFSWACCFACPRTMIALHGKRHVVVFSGFRQMIWEIQAPGYWRWNPTTATSRKTSSVEIVFSRFLPWVLHHLSVEHLQTWRTKKVPQQPIQQSLVSRIAINKGHHAIPLTLKTPSPLQKQGDTNERRIKWLRHAPCAPCACDMLSKVFFWRFGGNQTLVIQSIVYPGIVWYSYP